MLAVALLLTTVAVACCGGSAEGGGKGSVAPSTPTSNVPSTPAADAGTN